MQKKTVAVFFGGRSNEREISVITGTYACNLLKSVYRVLPVYLHSDNTMYSSPEMQSIEYFKNFMPKKSEKVAFERGGLRFEKKRRGGHVPVDCALNCCHGGMGEDGTLSSLFAFYGILNASPETAVSSAFMDKSFGKIVARGLDIPVLPSVTLSEGESPERALALGFPLIVKPARLGSSIGIKVAQNGEELSAALELAFRLDGTALAERYLKNKRDVNCAAFRKDGKIVLSACEEVFTSSDILTFSEKYEGTGERQSRIPAELPEGFAERIREYTGRIYRAFGVTGVVRADFLVTDTDVYFNELNTVPGSLASYLFADRLTEVRSFLCALVEEGLRKPCEEKEIFETGILDSAVFAGAKACKRH